MDSMLRSVGHLHFIVFGMNRRLIRTGRQCLQRGDGIGLIGGHTHMLGCSHTGRALARGFCDFGADLDDLVITGFAVDLKREHDRPNDDLIAGFQFFFGNLAVVEECAVGSPQVLER